MSRNKKITSKDVGAFLEHRAQHLSFDDVPIFYGDLAAHFKLPPITEAWHTHPLCSIFEELDVEDAKHNQPFRTVLVVSHEHSIPGPGFFKTVAQLCPRNRIPRTDLDKMSFFSDEVQRLLKHYGNATVAQHKITAVPGRKLRG